VNDGYGASDTATITIEVVFNISVSGTVLNAVDRSPVANVLVTISGQTGTTNANGNYTIPNVGTGNHDAAGSSDGFCPFSAPFTIPDDHDGESFTYNFSMSPVLEAGQTRMVLNWGATPQDLDSHLLTPEIEGNTHHISYSNTGSYIFISLIMLGEFIYRNKKFKQDRISFKTFLVRLSRCRLK
jgi:hypothetical protein